MNNRLDKSERDAIKDKYRNSELLYKLIEAGGREVQRNMLKLNFTAEELFLEVMSIVDDIKLNPKDASNYICGLWNRLYCDLRDLDVSDAPDVELKTATSEIMYIVLLFLNYCNGKEYSETSMEIAMQLTENHSGIFERMQVLYMNHVWRIGEDKLSTRIREYMNSDEIISEDIKNLIKELPSEVHTNEKPFKGLTTGGSTLTNRQLVILFEHLLDISLQPEYTNIKALSELLSHVSGRSAGSIRQTIMKGVEYESVTVHNDIDRIEALIRPISEKIADKIKSSKE